MRRAPAAVALGCALAVAGCGSTVQVSSSTTGASAPSAEGLQLPGSVQGQAPGLGQRSTGNGAVTVPGAAGSSGTTGAAASGTAGAGGGTGGATVLGPANRTPIKLAYTIWDQAGFTALTGNTQAGQNSGANQGADEREMNALVAYANATGGVGGRKIAKPVGIKVSTADATSEQTMAAYCTRATEDVKADVFIDRSFFVSDNEVACFAKHRTTLVSFLPNTSDALYAKLAPYVASTQPSLERTATAFVKGLADANFFKGATVGVVLDDAPSVEAAYQRFLLPGMKALGVTPRDVIRVSQTDSSAQSSQASSAVLKFRSEQVDHVVYFSGFLGQLAFTNTADSQGYYPRYGWSDYGGDVGDAGFYVSATQNANAVAVSAAPDYVVDPDQNKTRSLNETYSRNDKRLSPGARRCFDVMSKYTGVDYYQGNSGRSTEFKFYCDNFFLWLDAARRTTQAFSPATWAQGLSSLGSSYLPVLVHSTDFSHRFGGADSYRVGIYSSNAGCKCFPAIGPWRKF